MVLELRLVDDSHDENGVIDGFEDIGGCFDSVLDPATGTSKFFEVRNSLPVLHLAFKQSCQVQVERVRSVTSGDLLHGLENLFDANRSVVHPFRVFCGELDSVPEICSDISCDFGNNIRNIFLPSTSR